MDRVSSLVQDRAGHSHHHKTLAISSRGVAQRAPTSDWQGMGQASSDSSFATSTAGGWIRGLIFRFRHHRAAILSLAVRGCAVLAGFAVTYMIGRSLGAAATGRFALVSQSAAFFAVVGLLGLDIASVRHFAKAIADKVRLSAATMLKICVLGLGFMVVMGAVIAFSGDWVWRTLFGDAVPRALLLILCLLLVARGGTQLLGAFLRSQHRFTLGQIISALAIPATTALALVSGLATTIEEALWAAAFGGGVAIIIALASMIRHISFKPDALKVPVRSLMVSAIPLWGVGIANNLSDWYGLAMAASMFGAAEAGLYRVAVQISAVLQIISAALFAVYSAKISTAHHAGDIRQVALLARSAVRLSTATALPAAIFLIASGEFILGQIGEEFVAAIPLVYILVIGQLAFTLTGPCGLVLAMSGNERINLAITIAGTVLLLLCVPIAGRQFGLEGIALCIAAIMLLRNLCAYVIVRQKLGIGIWTGTVRQADRKLNP